MTTAPAPHTPQLPAALGEIVASLVAAFAPEQIYLFGSQARGDAGEDSDYDLMVIVPHSDDPPYRRAQQAYAAMPYRGFAVDVLVWTHDEFYPELVLRASFPSTVVREGVLVYGE